MQNEDDKKEKLLEFLYREAFDPILKAPESKYKNEMEKKKLKNVKKSTEKEKDRFSKYKSGKEVKENYLRDLNSKSAKKTDRDLKELNLPTLPELKEQFLELYKKLDK
jgi:hypothetical protein